MISFKKIFLILGLFLFFEIISQRSLAQMNSDDSNAITKNSELEKNESEDPNNESKKDIIKKPSTLIANIIRSTSTGTIQNLTISQDKLPIVMVKVKDRFRPMVEVPLGFARQGWSLLIQGKVPVTPTADPEKFSVFAYMNGRVNELYLIAIGPNGEKESERLYIYAPDAQEFNLVSPWDAVKLTLGSSLLYYKQAGLNDFYSWSGLLSFQIHSPEEEARFGFLGEANVTALTVRSNQSNYGPQVGNGLIDGIYFFPWNPNSRWRFQGLAGVNYTTMFSNGAPFGLTNLLSPELGFKSRYIVNEKIDYSTEFRFMPMSSAMDFKERGLMFTISKSWILSNSHRAELGIKLHDLQYGLQPTDSIKLRLLSFVLSYSL